MSKKKVKALAVVILFLATLSLFYFFPPTNIWIVITGIGVFSTFITLLTSYFVKSPYYFLIGIFIVLFLIMNYFVGFQILNTILLLSFIIGVIVLIKNAK